MLELGRLVNMFNFMNKFKEFLVVSIFAMIILSSAVSAQQAAVTPWSGWWWPYKYGGLATGLDYRGHPAPLEKYELLTLGYAGGDAVKDYLKMYYNPSAVSWAGLCPYWARAAMLETYQILPSSQENIVFRVGDKKGLLTLLHDGMPASQSSDGDDPVNLHMWLLGYINDKNVCFTADIDPGVEVWYHPIYRYDMTSQRAGSMESVTVRVYYADDKVNPDYMGISERLKIYTYELTLNARNEIIDGKWTGKSIEDHPDTLTFPITTQPKNPHLNAGEIRRIARAKDDFLEFAGNKPVGLEPGTYQLVLLNSDQYVFSGKAGDEFYLEIIKDDSSKTDMQVRLTDVQGEAIVERTLTSKGTMVYSWTAQHPPYTLLLSQKTYSDPNIYTLTMDHLPTFQQHVPYIPKNGPWCGFAIANAGSRKAENVRLVTSYTTGKPLQTVLGPISLNSGEKKVVMFEDLPWRPHEYADTDSLYLLADEPVQFVNLFAADLKPMAGFNQGDAQGTRLVIPDTYRGLSSAQQMFGGVINESFTDAPVVVRIFDGNGQLRSRVSLVIPAGGKTAIQPGISPFVNLPDGGWMDIVSSDGLALSAYQYTTNKTGKKDAIETLFALPVGTKVKYVPHVTPVLGWWATYVTLINPSPQINSVNFHLLKAGNDHRQDVNMELAPFEKKVVDVSSPFGKLEGESLYRSVLEITGQYAVVGYYTYSPPYGGDEASFPLLDANSFAGELVLPHQAGDQGSFWTGAGVCNPSTRTVEVTASPYNHDGVKMQEAVEKISLGPGAYDVFTVSSKFGENASRISFIRFQSNNGPIGGFYMFGNIKDNRQSVEMLAGANLRK